MTTITHFFIFFRYNIPKSSSASQMPSSDASSAAYGFSKQQSMPALRHPPAYRPPPGPASGGSLAEPPPYREPPRPELRYRGPSPSSSGVSSSGGQQPPSVRLPHYSPPPTHRTPHLSRHPSKGSLGGGPRGYPQHGLPYRQQQTQPYSNYQVHTNHKLTFCA